MSVPSIRPLAPAHPAGPIEPSSPAPALPVLGPVVGVPQGAPPQVPRGTPDTVELGGTSAPSERAAARLRDWRAFDLVDGRRRQARGELAVARRALEERSARHAPARAAARALIAALAANAPLGQWPARAETDVEEGFWLGDAVDVLRLLADGDEEGARARTGRLRDTDRARARLFVALGALRARLAAPPAHGRPDAPATADTPAARPLVRAAGGFAVAALAAQRPEAVDPAAIPLLDAHARGLFGAGEAETIEAIVDGWMAALAERPGQAERELRRWSNALGGLCPTIPEELFPALRGATGESWPAVAAALRGAALPAAVEAWCGTLDAPGKPTGETAAHGAAPAAVDAALAGLIAAPDAEEAALAVRIRDARTRLRGSTLDDADEPPASAPPSATSEDAPRAPGNPSAADDAPRDRDASPTPAPASGPAVPELSPAPFGQWLATIAMAPMRVGASPALRRWAVRRARAPVLGAFDLLAEEARTDPARNVAVALDGWRGRLADPDGALVQSLDVAMRRRGAASELAVREPRGADFLLGIAVLLLALGALVRVWALALAGVAALAAWRVSRGAHEGRRARARAVAGMAHARAVAALRAVVDEWAAVRRDLADGVARMPAARERLKRTLGRSGRPS